MAWRWIRLPVAAALMALAVAACSTDEEDEYVERPVDQIYNEAMNALEAKNYKTAAKLFDEVERQHPYSAWATKAQLMAAYANYQDNLYDDAIIALDRFLQLHPSHKDAPYALYLKALSHYEQISDVARDQETTMEAMKALNELQARYPDSRYARDAKIKMDLTFDHLAGKEMSVGRYYLTRGQYLAAINRFKRVVDEYQTTTHVPEALLRLVEAYLALGLKTEAQRSAAVLGHNFPGSEWYIDAYELVEKKRFRPEDKPDWYEFWKPDDDVKRYQEVKPLPPDQAEDSWYQVW